MVFVGRGAQGRRKDAHSRWEDCTFFAFFEENCRPMVDLGNHFGAQIDAKIDTKIDSEKVSENNDKMMKKPFEHLQKNNANSGQFLDMFFFEKHVFSLVLQWFL